MLHPLAYIQELCNRVNQPDQTVADLVKPLCIPEGLLAENVQENIKNKYFTQLCLLVMIFMNNMKQKTDL